MIWFAISCLLPLFSFPHICLVNKVDMIFFLVYLGSLDYIPFLSYCLQFLISVNIFFLAKCLKLFSIPVLKHRKVKVKLLGHVQLFETPWTVAHQAPLSMGFSRQEFWSGLPLPSPFFPFLKKLIIFLYIRWDHLSHESSTKSTVKDVLKQKEKQIQIEIMGCKK